MTPPDTVQPRRTRASIATPRVLGHAVHTGTPVARLALQQCAVTESIYPSGARSHSHEHESPFINATLSGYSLSKIGSIEPFDCNPGDIHFIPAGVEHSHVTRSALVGVAIDLRPEYTELFRESRSTFRTPLMQSDPAMTRLAWRLREEIRNPDGLSHLQVDALIVEMCVSLARLRRRRASTMAPAWLKRIAAEVAERFREDLSLERLAAAAHVHPVHVSRAFREVYGETLGDYIRRLRIQEARRLLESTSALVAEIAAEVGYHDESHLTKAFKRVVGTTPGHYRSVVRSATTIVY